MFCLLQVAGYAEIFQGMTPILGLTVTTVISTPQSDDVSIELFDNGVGKKYYHNCHIGFHLTEFMKTVKLIDDPQNF